MTLIIILVSVGGAVILIFRKRLGRPIRALEIDFKETDE